MVNAAPGRRRRPRAGGFTLIELLVVLAIIATLLTVAVPRYQRSVERAREATLRQDLALMRDALDKHYADTGRYPDTLDELVRKKYLRNIPADPVTGTRESWRTVAPQEADQGGIFNVTSGAPGQALDGSAYADW